MIRIIMAYLKNSIQLCFVMYSGPFLQTGPWYSLLKQRHVLRLEVSAILWRAMQKYEEHPKYEQEKQVPPTPDRGKLSG